MTLGVKVLPTNVDWIRTVQDDYVAGHIDIEQLERDLEQVLDGHIPDRLIPGMPLVSDAPRHTR